MLIRHTGILNIKMSVIEKMDRDSAVTNPDNEQFLIEFDEFAGRILSPTFNNKLQALWKYSPEYDETWLTMWSEYEKLDAKRKSLDIARLDWQDVVEEWRRKDDETRETESTGHYGQAEDKVPLFYKLHLFHTEMGNKTPIDRFYGWKSAREGWYTFCETYETSVGFRATLSPVQKSSFKILHEWWNSSYYPSGDVKALETRLDELVTKPSFEGPLRYSFGDRWISHSHYHSHLLELFIREFHPMEWEPYACRNYLTSVMASRQSATQHAIFMRFSHATLAGQRQTEDQQHCLPEYTQPVRDMAGWKGNAFFEEPPLDDPSGEKYRLILDATAKPPKYLWHVPKKQAVRVEELSSCPDYLCVSHTWGRFTHRPEQWINIPGVRWPVKSIRLYDVRDVPDMLFGLGAEYVWLDLFCLPQLESPEHHEEVANQTAIFRRAKACVWHG